MPHKTARQWLETLVGFDTTSEKTNIPLIECVAAYLQECGLKPVVLRSPDGIHANLLATLPAADGSTTGGLVLSGHSDVVPVTGQKWDTDPYKLVERDGKLYGRGSCDMKGFIAIVLSLVPEWLAKPRSKALHIALTHSEETTFNGVRELLKERGQELLKCDGCIIGEPTMLDLVIAHKGINSNYITFRGKAAHSSLQTDGYNAIEPASRLLSFLFGLRDRFATEGPFDKAYPTPHTTLCPSQARGGIAMNTIPESCTISYEFRNIASHAADPIVKEITAFLDGEEARMRAQAGPHLPADGVVMERKNMQNVPAFNGNPDASVVKALQATGQTGELLFVSFGTEASSYQEFGIPSVVCGPGDIAQAHKVNEFITLEQMEKGEATVRNVVQLMCKMASASQL